jgi:moderate conductance mechanosensitive channel
MHDDKLPELLLDEPTLMGVESIEVDSVNLRMVTRTLPGKQFEVGRKLRALVVAAFRRDGIDSPDGQAPVLATAGAGGDSASRS